MTATFRPIFTISVKVSCIDCRTALTTKQFAHHDCEERRLNYEANMQYIDDRMVLQAN